MKKNLAILLCFLLLLTAGALAENTETVIALSDETITVNGTEIAGDPEEGVCLLYETMTHEDVAQDLQGLQNRVVVIAKAGTYRISGRASDLQIAVRAGESDGVRLILDGADISCRTAPAIAVESALDPRTAGQYGVVIELAEDSENFISGSHTVAEQEDGLEYDGAIGSQVSLGFEGSGSLTVDADNEGIEVAFGHMTINGGRFAIAACDDPLNVAQDGEGTLTINDGYVYSYVKPIEGGEGDGVDSNGTIVFNGGTVINLAHPGSMDSGIDADMGSTINGGTIVGAGNMYDPIEENSGQLFMMLEFSQETDDLVVVTDEHDQPVFAYDFPHDYMYIAFSTPALAEGTYHVYLGGSIEGTQENGLYTDIVSYVPGTRMQHGEGTANRRTEPAMPQGGAPDVYMNEEFSAMMQHASAYQEALAKVDLNELLKDANLNELLKPLDLNLLLDAYSVTDLLTEEQIAGLFGDLNLSGLQAPDGAMPRGRNGRGSPNGFGGMGGGFGGPRRLESSADSATADFVLKKGSTSFTNIVAAQ